MIKKQSCYSLVLLLNHGLLILQKSMLIYLESVAVIKVIIIRYNILLFWVHL